jgi:hypothetical protein
MTTLIAEDEVYLGQSYGSSLYLFPYISPLAPKPVSVDTWWKTTSTSAMEHTQDDLKRASVQQRMLAMAERVRARQETAPDYPDSDEQRTEQLEVTEALANWQAEAIRDA